MSNYDPTKHLVLPFLPELSMDTEDGKYEGFLELDTGNILGYASLPIEDFLGMVNSWLAEIGANDFGEFTDADVSLVSAAFFYDPLDGGEDEWYAEIMGDNAQSHKHLVYYISV